MRLALVILLSGMIVLAEAAQAESLDCPLRDWPYSPDSPIMDILLSPAAKAVVDREIPDLFKGLPPSLSSTTAPSMSAIMTLREIAGFKRVSADQLATLAPKLAAVPISEADKKARCARYDNNRTDFTLEAGKVNVLLFTKINGFDHGDSVTAATRSIKALAEQLDWTVVESRNGGDFNTQTLQQFDLVVWNNNSGDVLTLTQRAAFKQYIENGGGYLGIHGAGGDRNYLWDWYTHTLLGAQFIGHPMNPQFQRADIHLEKHTTRLAKHIGKQWSLSDEWYSFLESPRKTGADIVATLDESTYSPVGMMGQELRMGNDHPIVWTRCVESGRAAYTAIGHRAEVYHIPENLVILRELMRWSAGQGKKGCN